LEAVIQQTTAIRSRKLEVGSRRRVAWRVLIRLAGLDLGNLRELMEMEEGMTQAKSHGEGCSRKEAEFSGSAPGGNRRDGAGPMVLAGPLTTWTR
jgi:hypothetical protein